ncbi:hypothetical protein [Cryobacterium glaciale]|nr:hypothetical protein [Cryobacterium glaciale]
MRGKRLVEGCGAEELGVSEVQGEGLIEQADAGLPLLRVIPYGER